METGKEHFLQEITKLGGKIDGNLLGLPEQSGLLGWIFFILLTGLLAWALLLTVQAFMSAYMTPTKFQHKINLEAIKGLDSLDETEKTRRRQQHLKSRVTNGKVFALSLNLITFGLLIFTFIHLLVSEYRVPLFITLPILFTVLISNGLSYSYVKKEEIGNPKARFIGSTISVAIALVAVSFGQSLVSYLVSLGAALILMVIVLWLREKSIKSFSRP